MFYVETFRKYPLKSEENLLILWMKRLMMNEIILAQEGLGD